MRLRLRWSLDTNCYRCSMSYFGCWHLSLIANLLQRYLFTIWYAITYTMIMTGFMPLWVSYKGSFFSGIWSCYIEVWLYICKRGPGRLDGCCYGWPHRKDVWHCHGPILQRLYISYQSSLNHLVCYSLQIHCEIRWQVCTYHGSSAVMACAELRRGKIIIKKWANVIWGYTALQKNRSDQQACCIRWDAA